MWTSVPHTSNGAGLCSDECWLNSRSPETQLSNVEISTLAEIGQQAESLAVVVAAATAICTGAARTLARYDINASATVASASPTPTRTTPCSSTADVVLEGHYICMTDRFLMEAQCVSAGLSRNVQHQRSAAPRQSGALVSKFISMKSLRFSDPTNRLSPLRPAPCLLAALSAGGPPALRRHAG